VKEVNVRCKPDETEDNGCFYLNTSSGHPARGFVRHRPGSTTSRHDSRSSSEKVISALQAIPNEVLMRSIILSLISIDFWLIYSHQLVEDSMQISCRGMIIIEDLPTDFSSSEIFHMMHNFSCIMM
jgi:hypothetical protein